MIRNGNFSFIETIIKESSEKVKFLNSIHHPLAEALPNIINGLEVIKENHQKMKEEEKQKNLKDEQNAKNFFADLLKFKQ